MVAIKIIFSIAGDNLYPEQLLPNIDTNELSSISFWNPTDKKKHGQNQEEYGFGHISFMHPDIFWHQGEGITYEKIYIDFLVKNHEIFVKFGAEDFDFYFEVYYYDDQCNFEIFDKELLKKINGLNVSIPVSIYHLSQNEFEALMM
jgi:hypothetical protein